MVRRPPSQAAAALNGLATAACTQDELADGDRLPEGQYPVEIARITLGVEGGEAQPWGAPQTRVGEAGDGTGSVFSAGDRFAVQINGEEGIYIVQDDGSIKAESPLYWSDTGEHTVTAWQRQLPDTRHADLHPPTGQGARHAHSRGARRGNLPPALYLYTVYL